MPVPSRSVTRSLQALRHRAAANILSNPALTSSIDAGSGAAITPRTIVPGEPELVRDDRNVTATARALEIPRQSLLVIARKREFEGRHAGGNAPDRLLNPHHPAVRAGKGFKVTPNAGTRQHRPPSHTATHRVPLVEVEGVSSGARPLSTK